MSGISTPLVSGAGVSSVIQGRTTATEGQPEDSFPNVLADMLKQYNRIDNQGDQATLDLLTGGTDDLSVPLIAAEKAEIALSLTVAIRNKAVDAYKEIMNMQV